MKNRIKMVLLCALIFGAIGNGWTGQTVADVKRIYEKITKSNRLDAPPVYVVKCINKKKKEIANAANLGDRVIVCRAMLKMFHNKEELALTLGHELGHMKWNTEQRADQYGAIYARTAGYNYCKGAQLLKRFGNGDMPIHPPGRDRYAAMRCTG